ncbi:MAG: class I SAM-dependent methyltransferase [Chitinophagales bacterium]|nr:class I SAM-dependent methyltransferase [Chitinophagales bacterium]
MLLDSKQDWFKQWFDSPYYDVLYSHRNEQEAQLFIDNLLAYLKPKEHARMLDMACGSGRHSIYLANKGYNVTGIDLSVRSIAAARSHESGNLHFYEHDIRNYFRIHYFDYIFSFFTSLGYFQQPRDNFKVVRSAYAGLKEGGNFVVDFFNADKVLDVIVPKHTKTVGGIEFQIEKRVGGQFIIKDITFEADGASQHFQERVQLLRLSDFEKYFKESGFQLKTTFGDYMLNDFNHESDRLIMIVSK